MSNIQTVQSIYAAFGRGDVPTILGHLHENIDWDYGLADAGVPWIRPRKSHEEVAMFFQSLQALDFTSFQVKTFLESGNVVVVLLDVGFIVKSTGVAITEEDEVHIWHFDDQGLVTRFTHRVDTHKHWAALQGK